MGAMSWWHWLLVLAVVVLLFGSKKLPDAARGLGRSMRIFKSEMNEMHKDGQPADAQQQLPAGGQPQAAGFAQPQQQAQPYPQQAQPQATQFAQPQPQQPVQNQYGQVPPQQHGQPGQHPQQTPPAQGL